MGAELLLDAAGGAHAEYLRAAPELVAPEVELVAQDALPPRRIARGVRYVRGAVDRIELPGASVDAIACHHSFEHFQGDLELRFLDEALRLLRPGGRLTVVPIFVGTAYLEIWSRRPGPRSDPRARTLYDATAAFAGWGPYEGFARVCDPAAPAARILARLPATARARVVGVSFEGRPAPDLARNRHPPRVNGEMKALVVTAGG